jgi:hypothetical protein
MTEGWDGVARVTVGMPVWNAASTIRESIDSVLAQDYTDFELIVSDNGSTDDTPGIVEEYMHRDSRVSLVRHPENLGGAANFSCLPGLATTELFKWQSGDDLIAPSMIGKCVAVLDEHPDAVLAYAKTTMIDEEGYFWRNHEDRLHLPQAHAWQRLHDFARNRWLCNPLFGVIRTDTLRETTLITPEISSDITLLAQLALRGAFYEVPERLFLRRFAERSCGLGTLSKDEVQRWFDPRRMRAPKLSPTIRVWWDIHREIVRAPLPATEKAATMAAFDFAAGRRRLGVIRYRRRLERRGEPFPTWDALREKPPADLPPGLKVRRPGGFDVTDGELTR